MHHLSVHLNCLQNFKIHCITGQTEYSISYEINALLAFVEGINFNMKLHIYRSQKDVQQHAIILHFRNIENSKAYQSRWSHI